MQQALENHLHHIAPCSRILRRQLAQGSNVALRGRIFVRGLQVLPQASPGVGEESLGHKAAGSRGTNSTSKGLDSVDASYVLLAVARLLLQLSGKQVLAAAAAAAAAHLMGGNLSSTHSKTALFGAHSRQHSVPSCYPHQQRCPSKHLMGATVPSMSSTMAAGSRAPGRAPATRSRLAARPSPVEPEQGGGQGVSREAHA